MTINFAATLPSLWISFHEILRSGLSDVWASSSQSSSAASHPTYVPAKPEGRSQTRPVEREIMVIYSKIPFSIFSSLIFSSVKNFDLYLLHKLITCWSVSSSSRLWVMSIEAIYIWFRLVDPW